MGKDMTRVLLTLGLCIPMAARAEREQIIVNPADCRIVLAESPAQMDQLAAEELQLHLELLTGAEIPFATADASPDGGFRFHIAQQPPTDEEPLVPQGSRWVIPKDGAWFYGDSGGAGT